VDRHKDGAYINLGGVPVDLNGGMIEALRNAPSGIHSRYSFEPSDMAARVNRISWFSRCGTAPDELQVTPPVAWVASWPLAAEAAVAPESEDADLEAQNQLTLWLTLHHRGEYANWNDRVLRLKAQLMEPLLPRLAAFQATAGLGDWFLHTVRWHILGAALENEYLHLEHPAVYFLELLRVYEAGRLPCGWRGRWPDGSLVVH
jgi:hypothetical protein